MTLDSVLHDRKACEHKHSGLDDVASQSGQVDCKPALMKDASSSDIHSISGTFFKTNKIFVGGLPTSINAGTLRAYFGQYGSLTACKVIIDKVSGLSKGYGFCEYADSSSVDRVIRDYHHHILAGKWVQVKRALPSEAMNTPLQAVPTTTVQATAARSLGRPPFTIGSTQCRSIESLLLARQPYHSWSPSDGVIRQPEQLQSEGSGPARSLLGPGDLYYTRLNVSLSTGLSDVAEANIRPPPPPLQSSVSWPRVFDANGHTSCHERAGRPQSRSHEPCSNIAAESEKLRHRHRWHRSTDDSSQTYLPASGRAPDTQREGCPGLYYVSRPLTSDRGVRKRRRLHPMDAVIDYEKGSEQRDNARDLTLHTILSSTESGTLEQRCGSAPEEMQRSGETEGFYETDEKSTDSPCDKEGGHSRPTEPLCPPPPSLMHSRWFRSPACAPGVKTIRSLAASALRLKRSRSDWKSRVLLERVSVGPGQVSVPAGSPATGIPHSSRCQRYACAAAHTCGLRPPASLSYTSRMSPMHRLRHT